MAHWSRQDLKRNELEEFLGGALAWIEKNRRLILGASGAVFAAVFVGTAAYYQKRQASNASWERLNLAETYAYAGRPDLSTKAIQELSSSYPASAAADFGLLFSGDLGFWQGRYEQALKSYAELSVRGQPADLMPFALAGQAFAYAGAAKLNEAASSEKTFLDSYPDHFLAPHVHEEMVRTLLALGRKQEAKAALERIALEYPGTPWAARAQRILQPAASAPKTAGGKAAPEKNLRRNPHRKVIAQ